MNQILAVHHVALLVSNLQRAREFYEGVLGLVPDLARPVMRFDGIWYSLGAIQIHLLCLPHGHGELPLQMMEQHSRSPVSPHSLLSPPQRGERDEVSLREFHANPEAATASPPHGGRDRHLALLATDWDGLRARLTQNKIAYTLSQSGRRALFCRDPDANVLELIAVTAGPL
ncbi:MAG: VOC family protein [Betaproteobacteria bacterium]|nr:VOC family protein [Betaproteobacteria bacterium]